MNYRHGFHAGNHADVLKHLALTLILARLLEKPASFAVLDTHAGAGLYDLESPEAQRSPEWRDGVGKLLDWADAPAPLQPYLAAVRALGAPKTYPGSPLLCLHALRAQDRYLGCELHPEEARALKDRLRGFPNAQIHQRDGYEAIKALTPFPERRGLILIDPPYEKPDEIEASVAAIREIAARFSNAIILWWRPLKRAFDLTAADAEIGPALRADLAIADPNAGKGLAASSLLIRNPPFGLEPALREALPALAERLAIGPGGFWRIS